MKLSASGDHASEKEGKHNLITEGNVFRALIIVAVPMIVANILQSILELVDMYFISGLGDDAIAGATMGMSIIGVMITVILGVLIATAAYISRAYGSEKFDRIPIILGHSIYMSIILSVIIGVIGLLWSENLLMLLGAQGEVVVLGSAFLKPLLVGIIVMASLMTFVVAFQAIGDTKTPMYVMLSINLLNIVLNPTLINGYFGMPAFGIAGSAYASLIARFLGILIFVIIMMRLPAYKDCPIKLPEKWTFEPRLLTGIIGVALPSALQSGIRTTSFLIMTFIIAGFGTFAVAAYGVCVRLDMMAIIIVMGFCSTLSIIVGQNLGAGRVSRANLAVRYALIINGIFLVTIGLIYFTFAGPILSVFGLSEEAMAAGLTFEHIVPLSYILLSTAMTLGFAMNGAGATRPGMYSSVIGQFIIQIALSMYFVSIGWAIDAVFMSVVIGIAITCLINVILYEKYNWRGKKLRIDLNSAE